MRKRVSDPCSYVLHQGDCLAVLPTLPDASVDAVVTDPPAGISFMGRAWDGNKGGRDRWIDWLTEVLVECRRVLKPGGHALVWALPRTSHWTATAVEDAGFEVRDVIVHLYGEGFPKSHDISKALDTDAARQWQGWGTALKPAAEHWLLARAPLSERTIAANVARWGTGAINVEACRIEHQEGNLNRGGSFGGVFGNGAAVAEASNPAGRWPANVCLDEDAAAALDAQSGISKSPKPYEYKGKRSGGFTNRDIGNGIGHDREYDDTGGASRFFYVAKASKRDRGEGNAHPTVKATALMAWLCRLITPPGGLILDPFAGSGSTGVAALQGGYRFIGIEREAEYIAIATARLDGVWRRISERPQRQLLLPMEGAW